MLLLIGGSAIINWLSGLPLVRVAGYALADAIEAISIFLLLDWLGCLPTDLRRMPLSRWAKVIVATLVPAACGALIAAATELCPLAGAAAPALDWSLLAQQSVSWMLANLTCYFGIVLPYFALGCQVPLWRRRMKANHAPLPVSAYLLGLAIFATVWLAMRIVDPTAPVPAGILLLILLSLVILHRDCDREVFFLAIGLVEASVLILGLWPGGLLARADQLWQANLWRACFVAFAAIAPMLRMPMRRDVHLSYAHGAPAGQAALRGEFVEQLYASLTRWGWAVYRDVYTMLPGESVADFMKRLGRGERVIVVISEKYLHSRFCMRELLYMYDSAAGDRATFQQRVVPIVLEDAKIDTPDERGEIARYWQAEVERMAKLKDSLGPEDQQLLDLMQRWSKKVGDILSYLADEYAPRGHDAICANDFRAIRELLD